MARRGHRLWLLLAWLLAAAAAGVAWLTHHPDAPLLERFGSVPLVAPLAERFRALYLGPAPAPEAASPRTGPEDAAPRSAGPAPKAGELTVRVESPLRLWVAAGTPLRRRPEPAAPEVARVEGYRRLRSVERRGDWFLMRYGAVEGWAFLPGYSRSAGPPLGSAPEPVLPLPARPPEPRLLAAGRELLGRPPAARLGPYDLYTDSRDEALLEFCGRLAETVETVYTGRYGRRPLGVPAEAVLLFRRSEDYRAFQRRFDRLGGLPAMGHAGQGIVALFAGGRSRGEIGATLLHELVHLLNRRALGPALPPWLDEGLADDLAGSGLEDDGTIRPEVLGGEEIRIGDVVVSRGGLASALQLGSWRRRGELPPLPAVLRLDWEEFVAPGRLRRNYVFAAFWVRFLVAGGDADLAAGFHSFLEGVSGGGPVTPDALRSRLGRSWEELDRAFGRWVDTALPADGSAPEMELSPPAR